MPNYEDDFEYMNIIKDILDNDNYNILSQTKHHNTTRLNHCLKVSYYSYKIVKKLHLSYKETARAVLLHDFYLEQIDEQDNIKDKVSLFSFKHPLIAIKNSEKYFKLTKKEKDIIKTHMFPSNIFIPKTIESWIVCFVDKYVSVGEFKYKFHQKFVVRKSYLYLLVIMSFFK